MLSASQQRSAPSPTRLTGESETDKSKPHDAALRVWHDATQATANHAVILGDKERPELYELYNVGCVVDLAEEQMGAGGGDLCVELKAYTPLVAASASPDCRL